MLRSILLGLDGSAYSESAMELSFQWARQFRALLVGLGIVDEPAIRREELIPAGVSAEKAYGGASVLENAKRRVEQFLEHFAFRCMDAGVASEVLEDVGSPYEQIILEAQRYDLIVLGQQTYFHFATQKSACETLQAVLSDSPRPVVTVPERLRDGSSVVIAYDGSLQAARALQAFQGLGLGSGRAIHIVSVDANREDAQARAERAADYLRYHAVQAEIHPLVSTIPANEVILDQTDRLNAHLLVMGAYGQPTLQEFFLGSVTKNVVHEAKVPVFLFH
jgi:nucleotide-binding universal stress UspA family protein